MDRQVRIMMVEVFDMMEMFQGVLQGLLYCAEEGGEERGKEENYKIRV